MGRHEGNTLIQLLYNVLFCTLCVYTNIYCTLLGVLWISCALTSDSYTMSAYRAQQIYEWHKAISILMCSTCYSNQLLYTWSMCIRTCVCTHKQVAIDSNPGPNHYHVKHKPTQPVLNGSQTVSYYPTLHLSSPADYGPIPCPSSTVSTTPQTSMYT